MTVPLAAAAARDPEGLALRPELGAACELARQRRREAYQHVLAALKAVLSPDGGGGAGVLGGAGAGASGGGGGAALTAAERAVFKSALLKVGRLGWAGFSWYGRGGAAHTQRGSHHPRSKVLATPLTARVMAHLSCR